MKKQIFNKRYALVFKQFNRKSYSLFAALGKEVLIGVLSVNTLSHARAEGIAVRPLAESDSVSFEEQRLDEVQIMGSRAPLTALQSAKIVEVISRDDIQRAEAQSINDILKLSTGVDVRQRGGFGVQTDISINGGTFDQITILLNGVPLTSPQTGHNAADFPVSLSDIVRIEVLEGASARIFGASAFSGAINIVTKPDSGSNVRIEGEAGSFGTVGGTVSATLAGLKNKGKLLRSNHQISGGYLQSDGGTDNSDFRKRRTFYQGDLQTSALDLNWQAGITSQDYGANTFYSAKFPNQYEKTRRYLASIGAVVRPFHAMTDRHLSQWEIRPMMYGHRDYDHYQLTKGATGAKSGENYHRMDVYGASLNINMDWIGGKTAIGADIRKEHILSTAYGDILPEDEWKSIRNSDRVYTREGNRTNTSLFAEHNIIVGGFTLSAGIMANKNTGLDEDFRFYPGVDLSYRPDDHWKFYASWNKALRVPTFTDLYTSNAAQQGDLNLKPERNSTFKIGTRFRMRGFQALVSGFYSNGTNMIDWVYETKEDTKYHALNIGKLDNMGFNIETTTNLTSLFIHNAANRLVILKMGYAYIHQSHETEHQIYKSLYALEYLRHKFVAELSHPVISKLTASWALRWQQRMNGYHPYAKLDGKLTWNEPTWQLYVKADNITGHRYYDLGAVKQPGIWIMAGGNIKLNF
ncbi:MAG: TonB-dependent receptor plug domain-containing protein [Prevotella sp.]|jgi:vitamin B12 transporter